MLINQIKRNSEKSKYAKEIVKKYEEMVFLNLDSKDELFKSLPFFQKLRGKLFGFYGKAKKEKKSEIKLKNIGVWSYFVFLSIVTKAPIVIGATMLSTFYLLNPNQKWVSFPRLGVRILKDKHEVLKRIDYKQKDLDTFIVKSDELKKEKNITDFLEAYFVKHMADVDGNYGYNLLKKEAKKFADDLYLKEFLQDKKDGNQLEQKYREKHKED